MKIFITGDRSMRLEYAILAASKLIGMYAANSALKDEPLYLVTGNNHGVEEGVARVAGVLGFEIEVVGQKINEQTGKFDWDGRHREIVKFCDLVVVIHSDILDSRIGASCIRVVPDDKLVLLGG